MRDQSNTSTNRKEYLLPELSAVEAANSTFGTTGYSTLSAGLVVVAPASVSGGTSAAAAVDSESGVGGHEDDDAGSGGLPSEGRAWSARLGHDSGGLGMDSPQDMREGWLDEEDEVGRGSARDEDSEKPSLDGRTTDMPLCLAQSSCARCSYFFIVSP